jgi:hypothetical protein
MLTHRHLLEHDVIQLKDGRTATIASDPRPRAGGVMIEVDRGDRLTTTKVPYDNIAKVLPRTWLDPIIEILQLTENQKALLKLYWEVGQRDITVYMAALFIKSTPAAACVELSGLVERGVFEKRLMYEDVSLRFGCWIPTKFGGAVLQRIIENTAPPAVPVAT